MNNVGPIRRLIPQSDRVLVNLSWWTLLASVLLPVVVHLNWPHLLRAVGAFGLFAAPVYLLLAIWQLIRYKSGWRTALASVIFALATLIAWGTIYLYAGGELES